VSLRLDAAALLTMMSDNIVLARGLFCMLLTPDASQKIRKGNYERLFDAARVRVRAWERANVSSTTSDTGVPAGAVR
jgi:hypothetical protein